MIIFDRVQAAMPTLSPSEKRVGKLCLHDPQAFSKLPVSRLADLSHVSKPTVVRFCRSVGYTGLSDFKLSLVSSVSLGVPYIHRSVHCKDKPVDVMEKVIDNTVAAFRKYRDEVNTLAVDRAVDALMVAFEGKHRIAFFGAGNSGVVAQDAQMKFFRLGVNTVSHNDGHLQLMSASLLGPGDCVVLVSNSGRTRDLIEVCGIARTGGATTIAITASGSPLAGAGNIHLCADHTEQFYLYSPMVSRLLHLMVVDILATCMALRIGVDTLQPVLQKMNANLRTKQCI